MTKHVCVACGRTMRRYEGYVSGVGNLCHPDDPNLRDCYHRWTVYGDKGEAETMTTDVQYVDVQYVTEADLEILRFALEARAEEVHFSGLYIEEEDVH